MTIGLLGLLAGVDGAVAGSWVRDAGSIYAKAGVSRFDGEADFLQGMPARSDAVEAYAELGTGAGWEVDLSARAVSIAAGRRRASGLGDLELLGKWGPVSGRTAVSLLGGLRIAPYRTDGALSLGPGGTDVLVGLGVGQGFGAGWTDLRLLHRHRLPGASAGLAITGEMGLKGSAPVGGALVAEAQPAYGRQSQMPRGAPVPRAVSLGAKVFADGPAGTGVGADAGWWPRGINDGPGWRVGLAATWVRQGPK